MKGETLTKLNAEGQCRRCQRPHYVRPLTRHRLVPGSLGGRYLAVNVVPLCRPCHDLIDGVPGPERLQERRMLRAALWPEEIAHAIRHLRGRFDEMYPPGPRELVLAVRRGDRPEVPDTPKAKKTARLAPARFGPLHHRGCHVVYGCVYQCSFARRGAVDLDPRRFASR